jgi:HK97 family phage portal protein
MGIFSSRLEKRSTINGYPVDEFMRLLGIQANNAADHRLGEVTFFTCVKILGEAVGKLPLRLYKDSEDKSSLDTKHYINRVLRRPNPHMTPSIFWATLETNKNISGNAYAYIHTINGRVDSLWILESDRVQVWIDDIGLWGNEGSVWYVYTDDKGNQYKLASTQVVHHKFPISLDGILGLSPIDTLKATFNSAKAGQQFTNNLFKNGITAGYAIYYTGDIDKSGEERLKAKIKSLGSGGANVGDVLPLPIGMKLEKISHDLVSAQFLELSKYTSQQISSIFGVKPSMLNDYANSKYASVQAEQEAFYKDTLLPLLVNLENELSYKLLTRKEFEAGYNFEFDADTLLRADFATRIEAYGKAIDRGIFSPNWARKQEGEPPDPNGDQLLVNGTYIPLSMVGQQYTKGGGENNEE